MAATTESRELNLLDKVELKIALADSEAKLQSVLNVYLTPLLLKLASEHVSVRNKVRVFLFLGFSIQEACHAVQMSPSLLLPLSLISWLLFSRSSQFVNTSIRVPNLSTLYSKFPFCTLIPFNPYPTPKGPFVYQSPRCYNSSRINLTTSSVISIYSTSNKASVVCPRKSRLNCSLHWPRASRRAPRAQHLMDRDSSTSFSVHCSSTASL